LFSKLEAVRKVKAFENATNAEIEAPMKVYLAGAAFRKKNYYSALAKKFIILY
jgi:hypothetical protein